MTSPTDCNHSFPDPHPDPIEQIGDCRNCGISYQAAKDAAAMSTAADELRAAVKELRPELSGREIVLPSGAIISRTLAKPLALLLEAVASNALENDHEECRSYCSPETCDVSAALTVARQINTGSQP